MLEEYHVHFPTFTLIKIDSFSTNIMDLLDLFKKYPNKDWNRFEISYNPNITWEMICANSTIDWDWRGISCNPNITLDIIDDNECRLNWFWLSKNPNIAMKFVNDNLDQVWSWYAISSNPGITMEDIKSNPGEPWDLARILINPNQH